MNLVAIVEFSIICNDVECLTVQLNKTILSVVYRSPTGDKVAFCSFMEKLLPLNRSTNETCVIMGDVNVNMITDEGMSLELKTLFSWYGCSNYITIPTRVTINSDTLLDICVLNLNECDVKSGVLIADVSDHLPQFCLIPEDLDKQNKDSKQLFRRIIRQNTLEQFRCLLRSVGWQEIHNETDINVAFALFLRNVLACYDLALPLQPAASGKKYNKTRKPWVDKDLYKHTKKKDAMYNTVIRTRQPDLFMTYKKFSNEVQRDIKKAKCN